MMTMMIACASPAILHATTPEESEALPYEFGCRTVFYGAEASDKPNNPCKGATIRKCAEIDTQIIQQNAEFCTLITRVKDSNGMQLHELQSTAQGTPGQIIDDIIFTLPSNAEIIRINR